MGVEPETNRELRETGNNTGTHKKINRLENQNTKLNQNNTKTVKDHDTFLFQSWHLTFYVCLFTLYADIDQKQ